MADADGQALLLFPYPAPRRTFQSPPVLGSLTWPIQLRAFYQWVGPLPRIPELCPPLPRPAVALLDGLSPIIPLGTRELVYGRELRVASEPGRALLLDSTNALPSL
jgi:hypothetical protein